MPKILLSNPYSRAMAARLQDIPEQVRPFYDAMADRLLWTLTEDDIAVVAGPVKREFLSYMCTMLGMGPDSISVLSLDDERTSWYPGHNQRLVADLRSRIDCGRHSGDWRIACYIRDRDVVAWERVLELHDASSDAFADNMAEMMNTKSVFRVLARSHGFPIADGCVVTRGDELYDAVAELLSVTGAVIIKQDMNSGGDGNVFVTSDPDIRGEGARWAVQIVGRERSEMRRVLSEVGLGDPPETPAGCGPAKYIVEVFHPCSLSFFAELYVPPDAPPRLCNYGSLRMTPLWSGFEIPARRLTAEQREQLCAQALRLAGLAQSVGYSGHFDCDAILTQDGALIFNEFNGRAGGATHMDVLCRRLLGLDYLDEAVLLTRNSVPAPEFRKLMLALDDSSLHFERERGAGIIITQDNTASTGTIEYIAIGRSRDEAASYERQLEEILPQTI
jgi:pheganomycin biosynthesis PGM1-like protein/pre ATP-grasp domain-containing protein